MQIEKKVVENHGQTVEFNSEVLIKTSNFDSLEETLYPVEKTFWFDLLKEINTEVNLNNKWTVETGKYALAKSIRYGEVSLVLKLDNHNSTNYAFFHKNDFQKLKTIAESFLSL